MDNESLDSARLVVAVMPDVFRDDVFAMKGGTAINFFVQDMPRVSVDIDLAFRDHTAERAEVLAAIGEALRTIARRLATRGFAVRPIAVGPEGPCRLIVRRGDAQMKVEVNQVFRGTVLDPVRMSFAARSAELFAADRTALTLAIDELYGSKLVAAMDRQHPRDFFDVAQMYQARGLTDGAVECFVTYLAGHNRPVHELLSPQQVDLSDEYEQRGFSGMVDRPVDLDALKQTQTRLFAELPRRLTEHHRAFLLSFVSGEPEWSRLLCTHAAGLPAIRWKLQNLRMLARRNPEKFAAQRELLLKLFNRWDAN